MEPNKTTSILKGDKITGNKSNIIADDELEDLFGIDMDDFVPPEAVKGKVKKKAGIQEVTMILDPG